MSTEQQNGAQVAQSQALTPYQVRAIELRESIAQDATPRAIVPRTFAEAQAFAGAIAHSDLVPQALKERAPDILMIILAGAELGIAPIRSLSMFHVIEGVPKLSSEGLGGIVTSSPLCEYLEPRELSASRVVFAAKRVGRPEVTLAFTDEDVKAANLDRPSRSGAPSNHVKFPLDMKVARARSKICKFVFPDISAGIQTAEEQRDYMHTRELEAPTAPIAFTAPPVPPTPPPAPSSTPPKQTAARSSGKRATIDTTATEGASKSSSSSSAPASSSTSSPSVSNTSSSAASTPPATGPNDPEAAARTAALAKAADNARTLEGAPTNRDPAIVTPPAGQDNATATGELGPTSEDRMPEATGNDEVPAATTDAVDPRAGLPVSDEDGFGDDDAPPVAKTIEAFESAVARCVQARDPAGLEAIKKEWLPWSKDETAAGGKQHAHRMRDAFARAKSEIGGSR